MIASEIIGAGLILVGWILFLYFLTKSPVNGSGWFPIEIPAWIVFAMAVVSVRESFSVGFRAIVFGIFQASIALFLSLPMIFAPLLIVCSYIPALADVIYVAKYWLIGASIATVLACSMLLLMLDSSDRSDTRLAFYCWPISSLLVTFGAFLL